MGFPDRSSHIHSLIVCLQFVDRELNVAERKLDAIGETGPVSESAPRIVT